jgi:hypothetical protein
MKKMSVLITVALLTSGMLGAVAQASAEKVDVCHSLGNGSYILINISANALAAHLAHGDGQPGDPVPGMEGKEFDEACNVVDAVEPVYVLSAELYYNGAGGWGGWSCPANHTVVDGGYLPATADVAVSMAWKPGASVAGVTYPATPFGYNYTPPEEGWIVQDGGTPNVPTHIYLWCLPPPP